MKKNSIACLLFIYSLTPAISATYSVGARASTLGLQGEFSAQLSKDFAIRLQGGGYHHYCKSLTFENVEYRHVRIMPLNFNMLFDWYFWKSGRDYGLRLSPGIGLNFNRAKLQRDLTPQNIPGVLSAKYRFNHFVPIAVVGYDSPLFLKNLFVSFDVGVYFQGRAKAKAKINGQTAPESLRQVAEGVLNTHWWVKQYPIVSLAIKYQL